MFGLRQQIGSSQARVGCLVGDHHRLGRAWQRLDADYAVDRALRQYDIQVAGAGDLIDLRHSLGAIGHRGDRLRATDSEHAIHAGQVRRRQHNLGHLAGIALRGRADHDLLDASDARRDRRHQQRRR
jgi:hypothetical protein